MNFLKMLAGGVGLAGLLSGCSVYDAVFHPYRLATPPMSAAAKAKAKAAEKARHKGLTLKPEEPIADGASPDPAAPAGTPAPAEKPKTVSHSELPAGTKLTYDKQGLLKKNKLTRLKMDRRQLHHYDTRPLTPREASRENRRIRKRGHHNDHQASPLRAAPTREAPDEGMIPRPAPAPRPDPTQPAAAPPKADKTNPEKATKPAPMKPAKAPVEKPKADKKNKKAPVPKPDPTQPQPFKGDQ